MIRAVMFTVIIWTTLAAQAGAAVTAGNLAIIVNDNDPQSVAVAAHYQQARRIPDANIIHVSFDYKKPAMSPKDFAAIREQVQSQVAAEVQAYALSWTRPFKVGCMSITAAFALGYDEAYCAQGCKPTKQVNYYSSAGAYPQRDFGIRPTMMLAGKDTADVIRLIDRGVAADFTRPRGTAYLVSTSDKARNVRASTYTTITARMRALIDAKLVRADAIENKPDVMFYFTGLKQVPHINSNTYLPGAVADHLTSTGGSLFGDKQMSAMKWLEAGATGSYGTVVEPCNFPGKFPNPPLLMLNYIGGATLIEAYWKSVAMPGQGLFIGEPLAAPFKGCRVARNNTGQYVFSSFQTPFSVQSMITDCGRQ